MYFKERKDTNIDNQFDNGLFSNISINLNPKVLLTIIGIIVLIAIIIFAIISFNNNSSNYTIKLIGEENIIITKDSDYIEPGYIAYDKKNNNVTDQVKITSNIDTSKLGEYEILYSIGDINKVRYITITDGGTYIRLNGNVNMYLEVGDKYIEPGYTVYDSNGESLTDKVKVSGSVNISKPGTYQITYTVTNSKKVTITKKRIVTVVEKNK